MTVLMNPDCLNGAHRACSMTGWCESTDQAVPCPCVCHALDVPPTEVYKTAPNGLNELLGYQTLPWQSPDEFETAETIDPAHLAPTHTAMQAKHLSGASIGKLVQYSNGRSVTTNEHLWSPTALLLAVGHEEDSVNLFIEWDEQNQEDHEITPDDWVLITQPEGATA